MGTIVKRRRADGTLSYSARFVAYVVADAPPAESATGSLAAVLHPHLSTRVPDYMIPAAFVRLDRLPVTPNGKLDRRALPTPDADGFARKSYAPPQGEIENQLALIWSELLNVDCVGRHDDFFALGGHSLMVARLLNRIEAEFDRHQDFRGFPEL